MATALLFEAPMPSLSQPRGKSGKQFGGAPLCPMYNNSNPKGPSMTPAFPGSPAKSNSSSVTMPNNSMEDDVSNFSDHCSLGDEFSLPGSPTGSCYSEHADKFPPPPLEREGEWRPRRASFEQPAQQPTINRNERRGFLPRHSLSSSGDSSHSSPTRVFEPIISSTGSAPLSPSPSASPSLPPVRGAASPAPSNLAPCHQFLGQMTSALPQRPSFVPNMGSGNSGKLPSLREQVLMRSSSGQSTEMESQGEEMLDNSECMNFDDVETLCQDKELEKDSIDSMEIVLFPAAFSTSGMPEIVLYALTFTSNSSVPVLPGDDSIRLLFPHRLQETAGVARTACARVQSPSATSFKPFSTSFDLKTGSLVQPC